VNSSLADRIAQNLAAVRQRIAEAAGRCGRTADDIKLVAVTKYVGLDEARALVEAGCRDLGESRPQQLWEKAAALGSAAERKGTGSEPECGDAAKVACSEVPVPFLPPVQGAPHWHLIGHLQRNKVRRTLPLVSMIHSADSPRLIAAIDEAADEFDCRVPILLEVNTSGEPAKGGFEPAAVEPFLPALAGYRHVAVRGLMCMASLDGGLDAAHRDFAALRQLRDRLRTNCPPEIAIDELSMGMSGDYETAIEEGATIVRIGSALFEGVAP
jgi:pyridoxal phosphate enzyme (YggS family)